MDRRWQLVLGIVAAVAGMVALWNVWSWGSGGRSGSLAEPAPAPLPAGRSLPAVGPEEAARMGVSLREPVTGAAIGAGLPEPEAASVADACTAALPAAMGWGVPGHLERSDRIGAVVNEAVIRQRNEAFSERALRGTDDAFRLAWGAAGVRERYRMAAEHLAAAGSVQISALELDRLEVRRDALQWTPQEGQSWAQAKGVANDWSGHTPARSVSVTVPVRFNDGRTGVLGFVCAPPEGNAEWVVSSGFLVVDSGATVPLLGL